MPAKAATKKGRQKSASDEADLDLGQVMPHHRAAWRVERIAWALGAIALIAALLGLLGYGPMSRTIVGTSDGIQIEYDRFQRSSAPTDYKVTAAPSVTSAGELRIRFDQSLVDEIEFDDIVPEPAEVRTGSGYTEFVFQVAQGGATPMHIAFRFRPTTFGHRSGQVATRGRAPLTIDQYIYP